MIRHHNTSNYSNDEYLFHHYVVLKYYKTLYQYAYCLCGSFETAEGLVIRTYAKAVHSISEKESSNYKVLLITILIKENDEFLLKNKNTPIRVNNNETYNKIMTLDNKYRAPLLLQVIAECNHDEISKILDIEHSEVKELIIYARSKLGGF
ncbi:hypothetical protein C1N51_27770 (plasmid) [Vibrio campbellii]|nr:hypothetical protein C1N51_27770 [Vibrio campbellii]